MNKREYIKIQIHKDDHDRLMGLAMRISYYRGHGSDKPPYPASIIGFAVNALEDEVNAFSKTDRFGSPLSNDEIELNPTIN